MKVASIQSNVAFGKPDANASDAVARISDLASNGVELVLLPECYLTGYCVDSAAEARSLAIERTDAAVGQIVEAAQRHDVVVVFGFAERDGDRLFNTAALAEPGVDTRFYRKTHLPFLGYDRFATPGDSLSVFSTRVGRIGLQICFDQRFPEPARVLALAGAELILIPTNWPVGAEVSADVICLARAAENRVWVVTANRVGAENGFTFIGRSKVISPTGVTLAAAGADEAVLIADIDLAEARQKRTITIPGKYETEVFTPRRIDLYGRILAADEG